MEVTKLIAEILATIGSLASGSMLIYSIIIFKKNIAKSEATKIREGLFTLERIISEMGNSIEIEKAQIYSILSEEPIKHTLVSIHNKIQVSYNPDIMSKVISEKLKEILPLKRFSIYRNENDYKKLANMKRSFTVSLRKMNALKYVIYLYCKDYQNILEGLQAYFDEKSLITNINTIFSENGNRLVTFESFLDALCLKCYQSLLAAQKDKIALLNASFEMANILLNALLDVEKDSSLVDNANFSQKYFSEDISKYDNIVALFNRYRKYYKETLKEKEEEVTNRFIHLSESYKELVEKATK